MTFPPHRHGYLILILLMSLTVEVCRRLTDSVLTFDWLLDVTRAA